MIRNNSDETINIYEVLGIRVEDTQAGMDWQRNHKFFIDSG